MKRKILAAVTVGTLAALALAAPAAAVSFETDYTTGSAPAGGTAAGCAQVLRAGPGRIPLGLVCFHSNGDVLSVKDQYADGHSVALRWQNYYNGGLYREGVCVETGGVDSDGVCNKNFHEGSSIYIQACTWESGPNRKVECGDILPPLRA